MRLTAAAWGSGKDAAVGDVYAVVGGDGDAVVGLIASRAAARGKPAPAWG